MAYDGGFKKAICPKCGKTVYTFKYPDKYGTFGYYGKFTQTELEKELTKRLRILTGHHGTHNCYPLHKIKEGNLNELP